LSVVHLEVAAMMSRCPPRRRRARAAILLLLPAVLVMAAASGSGCRAAAQTVQPQPVGEREGQAAINLALRQELERVNAEMAATFNRGDYLGAARFYTDDAQIIGPGNVRVTGRAAVDRYWASIPSGATWRLDVIEVGGSYASPWQLGRSTLVIPSRDPGGASNTSVVDFVAIWRRQPDRTLKLYIDMYVPAPRPTPGR